VEGSVYTFSIYFFGGADGKEKRKSGMGSDWGLNLEPCELYQDFTHKPSG